MKRRFQVGDKVVYTREKYTSRPGPRAKNVFPAPNGESYHYEVEKYWCVAEVRSSGQLLLETRRGKQHLIDSDDPRLRKASWSERIFKKGLFPVPSNQSKFLTPAIKSG
jgi:hypothetical protein